MATQSPFYRWLFVSASSADGFLLWFVKFLEKKKKSLIGSSLSLSLLQLKPMAWLFVLGPIEENEGRIKSFQMTCKLLNKGFGQGRFTQQLGMSGADNDGYC